MILLTLVNTGDVSEDIDEITGVAIDDDNDEWKLVEFSCFECRWAHRYSASENFRELYNEFKSHVQYVDDTLGEWMIAEARKMGNHIIQKHANKQAQYAFRC